MKVLITENKVKNVLKQTGVGKTIKLLGGWENFCEVLNIETPMDFLHLFDDLEQVKSEKKENWTLFRYKKGENLMIYDRKNEIVYINNYEIWLFIEDKFGLSYYETQRITQDWLDEVYNLRGVTTTVSKTISGGSWMRSTI
jgi:hypothetical protein